MNPADVVREVYLRLQAQGGEVELAHLARMSPDELRLLVKMERGWGPTIHTIHTPTPTCDIHTVVHWFPTKYPHGCPSSPPQGRRGSVGPMTNDSDVIRKAG